jgi:hypothetical protein
MVETTEGGDKINPFHFNLFSTFFAVYISMEGGRYLQASFHYNAKDLCWMIV